MADLLDDWKRLRPAPLAVTAPGDGTAARPSNWRRGDSKVWQP